ncbi:MAG: cytochrome c family protein, partial [Caenispirillum sp.]|nr:cytochrome c family protein [Caenispirillum sp.]
MSIIGKSVVALAVAIVLVFVVNAVGDIYNPTRTLEEPVYRAGLEGGAAAPAQADAAAEPEADIFTLISEASADDGAAVFKKCTSCHTIDAGGANRVGPNLHNVVGAQIAHHDGFNYSDALAGHGGEWTYENLDAWLTDPKAFAPGNKMTFAGIKDTADRAALIKYLMANTENPPEVPVPAAPAAAEQPAEAAPAEGEQP